LLCIRYAETSTQPLPQDVIQNVDNGLASFASGNTIVEFSRDKITNDPDDDITLDVCRYVLFAWGDNVNFGTREIRFDENRTNISETLLCFPSETLCPERCKEKNFI